MVRVLAIDPGTENFAFAVFDDDYFVTAGCSRLCVHASTYEVIAFRSAQVVRALIDRFSPREVWIESQMRRKMVAVAQSCLTAAMVYGTEAGYLHPVRWKHLVGLQATGNYNQNKRESIDLARQRGYVSAGSHNHNLADACLIALAVAHLKGRVEPS